MYKPRYIQYINLPQVPVELINELPADLASYKTAKAQNYHWSDTHNAKIDAWGKENICADMYFAFQLMTGNLPIHQDIGTSTKLIYVLGTGGARVYTRFWNDDYNLIDEYVIEQHKWHILKADTLHSVEGIEPEEMRWSITARVFGDAAKLESGG